MDKPKVPVSDVKPVGVPEAAFTGVDEVTLPMFDHDNGVVLQVPKRDVTLALQSGKYTLPKGVQVPVISPDGELGTVPSEKIFEALKAGYALEGADEQRARLLEEQYGGQDLAAAGAGAARALTFGLSDQLLTKSGLVEPNTLSRIDEANPVISGLGEVTGVGAGLLATGGLSGVGVGIKAAEGAGKLVAKQLVKSGAQAGVSKGAVNSIIKKVVEGGVEGSLYGAGQLVSEQALGRADFNAENLVGSMGVGALLGGAFGGALGATGVAADAVAPIAGKIAKPLRDGISNLLDKNKATTELLGMTTKEAERVTKTGLVEELPAYLKTELGLTKTTTVEELLEVAKKKQQQSGQSIGEISEILSQQGSANNLAPKAADVLEKINREVYENVTKPLEGTVAGQAAVKQVEKLLDGYRTKYGGAAAAKGGGVTFVENLSATNMLQEMRALDGLLKGFYRDPATAKEAIKAAWQVRSVLREEINQLADRVATIPGVAPEIGTALRKANKDFHITSTLITPLERKALAKSGVSLKDLGIVGIGSMGGPSGIIGAAVAKYVDSDLRRRMVVLGPIERANLDTAKTIAKTVKQYFDKTVDVAEKAVVYKLTESSLSKDPETGKKPKDPKQAFNNIQKTVQLYASDPNKLMEQSNARTAGIYDIAPETSAAMDLVAQRAIAHLNEKLPKSAQAQGVLDLLTDRKMPSSLDISKFERTLKAVENPLSVIKDLKRNMLTREGVEALKAVYPTMYEQLQTNVMDYIAKKPKAIDYNTRIRLGILLDMPTDISLIGENVLALQALHVPAEGQGQQSAVKPTQKGLKEIDKSSSALTATQRVQMGES